MTARAGRLHVRHAECHGLEVEVLWTPSLLIVSFTKVVPTTPAAAIVVSA
jgi:hypothetical protein